MRESLPSQFGKYLLLERIGVGGMAELFKAKAVGAKGLHRLVALKRLLPERAADQQFVDMFIDEARITVELSHGNIVQVHELGKVDDAYYLTMQYVAGRDLHRLLKLLRDAGQRLPVAQAARVATSVCAALDYAHRKCDVDGQPLEIIHRDVSPHNILIGYDGSVRIVDFGIARAVHRIAKTQAGVLKGKAAYMSPQQARYERVDRRTDIFSVGVVLWEMLAGQRLFVGRNEIEVLDRVRHGRLRHLSSYVDLPDGLEAVVNRALAFQPDERFGGANELAEALQPFLIEGASMASAHKLAKLMRVHFGAEADAERVSSAEVLRLKTEGEERAERLAATRVRPRRRGMMVIATRELAAIEPEDGVGWHTDVTDANLETGDVVPAELPEPASAPSRPVARRQASSPKSARSHWPLVAVAVAAVFIGVAIAVLLVR